MEHHAIHPFEVLHVHSCSFWQGLDPEGNNYGEEKCDPGDNVAAAG